MITKSDHKIRTMPGAILCMDPECRRSGLALDLPEETTVGELSEILADHNEPRDTVAEERPAEQPE